MTAEVGTASNYSTAIPAAGGWTGFFAALVAALWAYDGWNNVSMIASEVQNPQRNLPRALIGGVLLVIAIYLLTNLAYFYVLPAEACREQRPRGSRYDAPCHRRAWRRRREPRRHDFDLRGSERLDPVRFARAVCTCERRSFLSCLARKFTQRTVLPSNSILLLSIWSSVLVLTGRYEELYTLVIFPSWILYAMATASVIVLRRTRPDLPRPYKTIGYPVVPVLFVLVAGALILSTLFKSPRESILGLGIIAAGIPFYLRWRKNAAELNTCTYRAS